MAVPAAEPRSEHPELTGKGSGIVRSLSMPWRAAASDFLFGEVFFSDRVVMSLRVGLHFKTGEVRL